VCDFAAPALGIRVLNGNLEMPVYFLKAKKHGFVIIPSGKLKKKR
jgi:hypothetical protein